MKQRAALVSVFLFTFFFIVRSIWGDGVLIVETPHPAPGTAEKVPLSVKYHRVNINIRDQVAVTRIDQVFKNNYDADLEATYMFPLPEGSTVTNFSLWVDGKKVTGEVVDRERAQKIYEEIVRQMRDPGLLEYVGRNMFRARVYPVPRHGESRVELEYTETLTYDDGLVRYEYPLDTERFSPLPIEEVAIAAEIRSSIPLKSVYSPTHEVDMRVERYSAVVGFEERGVKPDTDFHLYYTVSEKDVGAHLLTFREGDEPGFFFMLLGPGKIESRPVNKDIVFLIDTSGSMSGAKLEQVQQALRYCLKGLHKGDRFNLIGFATFVNQFRDGLVPADEQHIEEALKFVDGLRPRGGTNINEGLIKALARFNREATKRPQMVVFLTDGEPTIGETNIGKIISNLREENRNSTRIFVLGVGNDVNTHLLDRISQEHRGVSEYVDEHEDIELVVSSFYRKISEPVLSNLTLDFGKIRTFEIYPATLPDLFKGTQLVLIGRYRGEGFTKVQMSGEVNGSKKVFSYDMRFPEVNRESDFIPRLWATRKIGFLMNEIRLNGENPELVDEIISLSKEYGIMTPYTSFLILDSEDDYERFGIRKDETELVKERGEEYKAEMKSEVGASSVARAKEIGALKKALAPDRPAIETVKHVGNKTFYLKGTQWIDSQYHEDMKALEVRYLSRRYLDLLALYPELGRYFALGKNVTVVFKNTCYQVKE